MFTIRRGINAMIRGQYDQMILRPDGVHLYTREEVEESRRYYLETTIKGIAQSKAEEFFAKIREDGVENEKVRNRPSDN